MMNGLRLRCVAAVAAAVAAAVGFASIALATVIQYQPHDQQRGLIVGSASEFTDNLGFWSESITDGSRSAEQTSLLGPQIMVAWNEVTGSGASSALDVRFQVNNTTPYELSVSASALGAFLVLRDLTTSTNLAFFFSSGAAQQMFTGELTAGHDFALTSTLQSPFGSTATSEVFFSIHQDDEDSLTLVPTPGSAGVLAMVGLAVGTRRRRS